ncbi:MAG: response regulator, partial [Candidatus Tectomicrobia bacterium]
GKGSILVMDDEEAIRDFVGDTLTAFGYEVAFAHDGAEAIAAYQHAQNTGQPFDAIIMDLTIPGGMGGKEAMARIHAYDPQVKAIVASGYSNDPIMTEYQRDHFRACIAKPYKAIALTRILHDVLTDNPT